MGLEPLVALPHKAAPSQPDGAGSLGFVGSRDDLSVVSCGSDAAISIRSAGAMQDKPATTFPREASPLTCLAVNPTGKGFAIGDLAAFVKVGPPACIF